MLSSANIKHRRSTSNRDGLTRTRYPGPKLNLAVRGISKWHADAGGVIGLLVPAAISPTGNQRGGNKAAVWPQSERLSCPERLTVTLNL